MSASERLKALEREKWYAADPVIRSALPQIVAVVEAAETYWADARIENSYALRAALDALEEALS